jgi:hypothetical protein
LPPGDLVARVANAHADEEEEEEEEEPIIHSSFSSSSSSSLPVHKKGLQINRFISPSAALLANITQSLAPFAEARTGVTQLNDLARDRAR